MNEASTEDSSHATRDACGNITCRTDDDGARAEEQARYEDAGCCRDNGDTSALSATREYTQDVVQETLPGGVGVVDGVVAGVGVLVALAEYR